MLGLFLLYFIGKQFHNLAKKYGKRSWPYIILGIAAFYVGSFGFGVVFGILDMVMEWNWFLNQHDMVINLMALPFAILACWGTYKLLEKNWSASPQFEETSQQLAEFGKQHDESNTE